MKLSPPIWNPTKGSGRNPGCLRLARRLGREGTTRLAHNLRTTATRAGEAANTHYWH